MSYLRVVSFNHSDGYAAPPSFLMFAYEHERLSIHDDRADRCLAHCACASVAGASDEMCPRSQVICERGFLYEGVALLNEAVDIGPGFVTPLLLLGLGHLRFGSLIKAAEIFERAAHLDAVNFAAHVGLAIVYSNQQRLVDSGREWAIAAGLQPDSADVWLRLGTALDDAGYLDTAINALEKALSLDPLFEHAIFALAQIYLREQRMAEAVDLAYRSPAALNALAWSSSCRGDYYGAQVLLLLSLESNPHRADTHKQLGCLYLEMGEIQMADTCFVTAARIDDWSPTRLICSLSHGRS